ncbi:MAG: RcpC/CpaB family pilus assembly protein [Acidimicrobiales bacterium]
MSSRRTIILVAAIVVAALATYVLLNYVRGVEEKAKPNPVSVYMISDEIKRGSPGVEVKSTLIKKAVIPAEYRPDTVVTDLNELDGKVAVIDLKPNQILVQGMFVEGERLNTSFKDKITGDNVAVALSFDTVRAVGGYVKPGDEVNLVMVRPVKAPDSGTGATSTPTTGAGASGTGGKAKVQQQRTDGLQFDNDVRYFYEKVRILAIGADVLRSPGETANASTAVGTTAEGPTSGGVIVFLVPPDVAQRLLAAGSGLLYMTLPSETWKPVPIAPIPLEEFEPNTPLPGENPNKLTPYGPKGYVDQSTVSSTGSSGSTTTAPTTTR